jgi:release factor glutamine methyltransferase
LEELSHRHAVAEGAGLVPHEVAEAARVLSGRRAAGEPLQHLLGHWPFRSVDLLVDRRALVPRPETELVADIALDELARQAASGVRHLVAADLGTGSGAIACAIATELSAKREDARQPAFRAELELYATDVSPEALSLAAENIERLPPGCCRPRLFRGDWFEALPPELAGELHLVVSNPPYLAAAEWLRLEAVVRLHDPYEALVAGPLGTEALDGIVEAALGWLAPGGALVLELAPGQAAGLIGRAGRLGYDDVAVLEDLAGRPRVLVGRAVRDARAPAKPSSRR